MFQRTPETAAPAALRAVGTLAPATLEAGPRTAGSDAGGAPSWAAGGPSSRYTELKMTVHRRLLDMINLSAIDKMAPDDFRREIGEMIRELLVEENRPLNLSERMQLVNDVLDELLGLGPIEPLLKDATVSDILVNTYRQVFVERGGRLELTPVRF
jgi:pilus assembly protein CpaF